MANFTKKIYSDVPVTKVTKVVEPTSPSGAPQVSVDKRGNEVIVDGKTSISHVPNGPIPESERQKLNFSPLSESSEAKAERERAANLGVAAKHVTPSNQTSPPAGFPQDEWGRPANLANNPVGSADWNRQNTDIDSANRFKGAIGKLKLKVAEGRGITEADLDALAVEMGDIYIQFRY